MATSIFHEAVERLEPQVIFEYLTKNKQMLDAPDALGFTALYNSIASGKYDLFLLLEKLCANIHFVNPHGISTLHLACLTGRIKFVRHLLCFGADMFQEDDEGNNAFRCATIVRQHEDVAHLLKIYYILRNCLKSLSVESIISELQRKFDDLNYGCQNIDDESTPYMRNRHKEIISLIRQTIAAHILKENNVSNEELQRYNISGKELLEELALNVYTRIQRILITPIKPPVQGLPNLSVPLPIPSQMVMHPPAEQVLFFQSHLGPRPLEKDPPFGQLSVSVISPTVKFAAAPPPVLEEPMPSLEIPGSALLAPIITNEPKPPNMVI